MKLNKLFIAICLQTLLVIPTFAELPENLTFSVSVDAAYYTKSDMKVGEKNNHYVPITGAYDSAEARICGNVDYKISTPLGENWLLQDANIVLGGSLELTPVSIRPSVEVTFTPLPFIVLKAGGSIGYGWDLSLMNIKGMATYNTNKAEYNSINTMFYKWWAQGTFQFDTGALIPGDWSHVVMMYSYQVYCADFLGIDDNTVYAWQGSKNKIGDLCNYQCGILAYQMPLILYRVGAMIEIDGYYTGKNMPNAQAYDASFKTISISPLAQFQLTEKDTLNVLCGFSSRRCYETVAPEESNTPEFTYTKASREWFFNRIAISYTHTF